jgi:preprotein translocase YajC subunit
MSFVAAAKGGSNYVLLIYLVVLGVFYFAYIRPRSRKQKAAREQGRQFEIGDRVQTIGGFVGTVVRRTDELVTLRTDGGHELDFIPSAVARKVVPAVTEFEPVAEETPAPEGDDN